MTKEYREYAKSRIEYLLKISRLDERDKEALEAAIKALSQEPCSDDVSREAVLDIVDSYSESRSNVEDVTQDMISDILALPPVTQKLGKWIEKDGFDGDVYYDCSVCGESWTTIEGTPWDNGMSFCPNCGARMESEK